MVLTLYKLNASPPVRAVLMVIEAIDLQYVEYVDVNVLEKEQFREEFVKLNPQHSIPTLVDDDFVIWDSHAIATYLITKYAEDDSLYPTDPKKRAVVDQRLHFDSGILFPAIREALVPILFMAEKDFKPEVLDKLRRGYGFADKFLENNRWLAGDNITVADISCVSSISTCNEMLAIDEDLYPRLADWFTRCKEQEFYKKGNVPGLSMLRQALQSRISG